MHHGSCLCGAIKFRITSELPAVQVCHCTQCRKAQGGAFATNILVDRNAIEFISGQDMIKRYESSPGKARAFCLHCGSPIFSERSSLPDVVRIRAGLLDEPLQTSLGSHAYTASKASWWPITDALPNYPEDYCVPGSP